MRRFYAPPDRFADGRVILGEKETRHLRDVLRLRTGDTISVFDGVGNEYLCRVDEIAKTNVRAEISERTSPPSPESPFRLTLAPAFLKGDKFDLVIQKAVELGVACLIPLHTARCDVKMSGPEKRLDRWRRICLEATKQSGRATLMEILNPISFADVLSHSDAGKAVVFSERNGGSLSLLAAGDKMTAIVGPEGGWDEAELAAAVFAGVPVITLGGRILRAETAAIAVSAILQNRFGDLN